MLEKFSKTCVVSNSLGYACKTCPELARCGWRKHAALRENPAHKAVDNVGLSQISNTKKSYRNNYFTWGRIMFWTLICTWSWWCYIFSQISREWERCLLRVEVACL